MKASLAPKEREISFVEGLQASIAQFLFPFVFTIIFSNFVISILVDTYLRKRSALHAKSAARGTPEVLSSWQVSHSHCHCACSRRAGGSPGLDTD